MLYSFQVQIKRKDDIVKAEKLLDGVCVFLTNHTEVQGRGFRVKPQIIIKAYRDKTKIGVNNKIKVIKRKAYGFHDLRYFTLKIYQAFYN